MKAITSPMKHSCKKKKGASKAPSPFYSHSIVAGGLDEMS